jgi:hypothetical protein
MSVRLKRGLTVIARNAHRLNSQARQAGTFDLCLTGQGAVRGGAMLASQGQ